MTQLERQQEKEPAYRASGGVAVWRRWKRSTGGVSVLVEDSRLGESSVVAAASEQALHDRNPTDEDRVLRLELELHLGHEPLSGCLRPERDAAEPVVGWRGFIDALKRLNERTEQP